MNNGKPLAFDRLKNAGELLHAIKHELRLEILEFLGEHPDSIVKDIYKSLDIEQSVASQHLGILKNADLVIHQRNGQSVEYAVNYQKLEHVHNCISNFLD